MTLSERATDRRFSCDLRSECTAQGVRAFVASVNETEKEVVVFRRDPATGKYEMSTACCEAVLPWVS
jgi:hypothetical protein